MYKILVRPILEYGAQVLSCRNYYRKSRRCLSVDEAPIWMKKIEALQNKILKGIIPCPRATPPALVRLFTGTIPMEGRLDMLKLRYFWKIQHTDQTRIVNRISNYKKQNFLESNVGFVHEIFNMCCKYNCMSIWHGKCPEGLNPYTRIKKIVENSIMLKM